MPEADEWTLLRIRRSTKQALERMRASMETGESMGLHTFTRDFSGRVGLDQVIMRLVEFKDKHSERSRRSRIRRVRKSRSVADETDQAVHVAGESNAEAHTAGETDQAIHVPGVAAGRFAGDRQNRQDRM